MREIKPLILVIIVVGIIYWGVEPLAHSIMHPKTPEPKWGYGDHAITGDAQAGEMQVIANCTACHSIDSKGIPAPMSPTDSATAYGVVPPDLSLAGKIFSESFLYDFIKDPVKATHLEHKFGPDTGKAYPMPGYEFLGDQVIMDMVAYLKSIAPATVSPKEVTEAACQRCHSIKYGGIEMKTPKDIITNYMGSTPPDLSMMIKSKGAHYLESFINDPQVLLDGTAMPRVGLTKEATEEVVEYLESVGDAKKAERESMGPKFLIYFAILAVLAYLWKARIWKELH
jgi:ubiquinol-cytochrome c reductase cytochrome c1 subunit